MQTTSNTTQTPQAPMASEIHDALARALESLDHQKAVADFRNENEFAFFEPFFDPRWVQATLAKKVKELLPIVHRGKVGSYKKSGSISYFDLQDKAPEIVELYRSEALRAFFSELAGEELMLSPEDDPHACALYYYTEPGDHIGFHYDKSWYRGARYTALIGLVQDSEHCLLECHLHKDDAERETQELKVATTPGSLVIFNGDKLWHGVSPLTEGEQRILLTLEYLTDAHMAAHKRLISNFKDAVAYFGFRGIKKRK